MKKEKVRRYLRRADDYMEEIERKMRCIDGTLFFVLLGMENFYRQENCYETGMMDTVRTYLEVLRAGDMAELHKTLDKLRKYKRYTLLMGCTLLFHYIN